MSKIKDAAIDLMNEQGGNMEYSLANEQEVNDGNRLIIKLNQDIFRLIEIFETTTTLQVFDIELRAVSTPDGRGKQTVEVRVGIKVG